jgi:putative DNA primase/helicase
MARVIAALEGYDCRPRPTTKGYQARCPAHDDRVASLSVSEGRDGKVLVKCFAGCEVAAVLEALGLTFRDLFTQPSRGRSWRKRKSHSVSVMVNGNTPGKTPATVQPQGCTLAQYAEAKKLPVAYLQTLGLRDSRYQGQQAVRIPYLDATGVEAAVRFRLSMDKAEGHDTRFRWKSGTKLCPYGLWRLADARTQEHVVLLEGESDSQAAWFHGVPALGIPDASIWKEEWATHLDGIPLIHVIVEPDRGGEARRRWLANSSIRDRVRLVSLGTVKDVSELHVLNPDGFGEAWKAALDASVPWSDHVRGEQSSKMGEAWK